MSLPTVVASRIYKAQRDEVADAEGSLLTFEKFPHGMPMSPGRNFFIAELMVVICLYIKNED